MGEGLRGCIVDLPILAGSDAFDIDSRCFILSEPSSVFTFVFTGPVTLVRLATAGLLLSVPKLVFPPIFPIRVLGFAAVFLVLSSRPGFEGTIS